MSGWVAGAVVVGSVINSQAAKKAAGAQVEAADRATTLQSNQYQQTREDQMPWMTAGKDALNKLIPLASDYKPFGMDQFTQDPGYAFRLSEGQKALDRSAAARGGLISGGALKAATRFGQDYGSQEYTNAFNRYQTERTAQLSPLQSLAGVGMSTAQQLSNAGQTMATNVGNNYMGAANARASGYVGGANALTSGLGTYLNYSQSNKMLGALQANALNNQYGAANVYGPGGAGQVPTSVNWNGP